MIPWFQYDMVYLGPIPIRVWGFFVALGMLVALAILWHRGRGGELKKEMLVDHALWMIICGLIGARVFHILFYEPEFYFRHPLEALKIWQGGLSSFGGLAGAAVGFFAFAKAKQLAKAGWQRIADLMSYAALYGWLVGRLGCVMIHDHPGAPCNCFIDLQTPDGPKLDMALLEIIFLLPLAVLFFVKRYKPMRDGWYTGMLFVYYGALRFFLDFLRTGDARYLGLTPAQFFGILLVFLGGFFLTRKHHGRVAYSS